jgi:hypothetical protein
MKQIGLAAVAALSVVVGFAVAARAATLTVSTTKTTYSIGETVTVDVTGDSQGVSDSSIDGILTYSAALTDTPAIPVQSLLLSGGIPWVPGVPGFSDGSAEMFVQSRLTPATVSNQLTASVVLLATGLGTVDLAWLGGLDFFGLTSAPGASFTVVSTPEPGTALLVGTGLTALAGIGRRRA